VLAFDKTGSLDSFHDIKISAARLESLILFFFAGLFENNNSVILD
jgi:hypothetical protein